MTADRKRATGGERRVTASRKRATGAERPGEGQELSHLRRRISDELASTHQVIASLSRQVESYRSENRELASARDRLREKLTQAEISTLEQADTEALWRSGMRARQEVEEQVRVLERDNLQLRDQCAELAEALARERNENETAAAELACLREQIAELGAIIALLVPDEEAQD